MARELESDKYLSEFYPWYGCPGTVPECRCSSSEAFSRLPNKCCCGRHPRIAAHDADWRAPLKWNKDAHGKVGPYFVMVGDGCDWADEHAPEGQRKRLWTLILHTQNLWWDLTTHQGHTMKQYLPADWYEFQNGYPNVTLNVVVENREYGIPSIEMLRAIPALERTVIIEPWSEDMGDLDLAGIDSLVIREAFEPNRRQKKGKWMNRLRAQCYEQNVAFF